MALLSKQTALTLGSLCSETPGTPPGWVPFRHASTVELKHTTRTSQQLVQIETRRRSRAFSACPPRFSALPPNGRNSLVRNIQSSLGSKVVKFEDQVMKLLI